MKKSIKSRFLAMLMMVSMVLSLASVQFVRPVNAAEAPYKVTVAAGSIKTSAQPSYDITAEIGSGSVIPQSVSIEIPTGYQKQMPALGSSTIIGTLTVQYAGKVAVGAVTHNRSVELKDIATNTVYDYAYTVDGSQEGIITVTKTGGVDLPATATGPMIINFRLNAGCITNPAAEGNYVWIVKDSLSKEELTRTETVINDNYSVQVAPSSTTQGSSPAYTVVTTVKQGAPIPQSVKINIPSGYNKSASVPTSGSTSKMGTISVNYGTIVATGDIYNSQGVSLNVDGAPFEDYGYTVTWESANVIVVTSSGGLPTTANLPLAVTVNLNSGYIVSPSTVGTYVWNVTDALNVPLTATSTAVTLPTGGGGATPPPVVDPGPIVPGGDNTSYNENILDSLQNVTEEQEQQAQLPVDAPGVSPTATEPVTLTTGDGLQVIIPPQAIANETEPVKVKVAVGTVMTPPKAESTAAVLNPIKYQREFTIEGRTDERVEFSAPVTVTFKVDKTDLPKDVVPQQLAIYWFDPIKGDWVKLGGVFDETTNTISLPTYHWSTYAVMADTSVVPNRLGGADRFATANAIAEQGWKAGAETVVLANAYAFPDALAAGPLAFKYNAPILLTETNALTPSTLAEMQKLAPKKIIIVGGTGVVSQSIEDSLKSTYGAGNVARYAGADRYETAAAVAKGLGTTGKAIIASGEDGHYADALAISSYAAYNGLPILFAEVNSLPAATGKALTDQKVTANLIAGGEGVISASIFASLKSPTRFGGADRYETAVNIAKNLKLNTSRVYVVTGLDFPDALVAGNLAAHSLSPIIMVDKDIPTATADFLTGKKASVFGLTQIGGTGVITETQDSALRGLIK